MSLKGKVAIVTGGGAGIGRAYVLALAAEGATVIATARSMCDLTEGEPQAGTLAEVVRASEGLPGKVHAFRCDVTDEKDVADLVNYTVANFGRIDVLVNNAGIYPHHETFSIGVEPWNQSMNVNALGPFLTMRRAAPHMMRQRSGAIVNLTSGSAKDTPKGHAGHEDLMLYCVSKAALNRLSTYMAEELKEYGIAVNALSPGAVDTDTWNAVDPDAVAQWKKQGAVKPCTPEAVGPAMLYLAQQTADGLTGQVLHTDEYGKSWP